MVFGFLKSWVDNRFPENPVKLKLEDDLTLTIPDIIAKKVPELNKGYSFTPLFPSGHLQTAYTAINKMEDVDQVHYARRLLTVENKTYNFEDTEAPGGPIINKLPYDSWEGTSTFTIDYAVSKEVGNDMVGDDEFKPSSQIYDLPPRTKYITSSMEKSILDNDKPLIIALHGLSGGSYESYIRAFVNEVTSSEYNFDALVLNARGCANHTITSPQLFNGLWTNDLRYLINEHIKPNWPNKKIFLIGFSLGGAILANYIGQEGSAIYSNIKAVAVMGTPWDFIEGSRHLKSSILGDKVYSPTMCQNVLRLLNTHYDSQLNINPIIKAYKDAPQKFQMNRLRDFDELFTSRLFGLNCADDYYRRASPVQRLWRVRVPTIIVLSLDDPITGGSNGLPQREVDLNPYVHLVTTSVGGHLGWFTLQGHRWYPKPLAKLFTELKLTIVVPPSQDELPLNIDRAWRYDRFVKI
ncbi:uncharacterized protein KQ657_002481 [Scheffersomyces spartinae]|uniref:AB hydrolase-1 domain-containing protein n=1 Tax=Scheffersomyces spartinae TaxID=45513 RepID=A0A9P8AH44_9ASCO|nr:uncharacterized protein KQ657_002481 [Scheffersomyces spartinae]KAG7192116.1 hypothetical protein KQ657_002481 [Scheffersomyces spartinae]